MSATEKMLVRPIVMQDRDEWNLLYQGYARFYKVEQTPLMRDTVWSWLHDANHESEALVAQNSDGRLIGLAHFRPFARPLKASTGAFLDDLYVEPQSRGLGAADALINGVKTIAIDRGWSLVRWITADDNYRGRGVYDRVASKTSWATYDIELPS